MTADSSRQSLVRAHAPSSAARVSGKARFVFPADLSWTGIDLEKLVMSRAELRFGLSDARGLGANPEVSFDGTG